MGEGGGRTVAGRALLGEVTLITPAVQSPVFFLVYQAPLHGVCTLDVDGERTCALFVGMQRVQIPARLDVALDGVERGIIIDVRCSRCFAHLTQGVVGGINAVLDVLVRLGQREDGGEEEACLWKAAAGSLNEGTPGAFAELEAMLTVVDAYVDNDCFDLL